MQVLIAAAVAGFLACGAPGAWADTDTSIEDTIRSQMMAFQADDFETAFGYASPSIRSLFGSAERFGAMVRGGYPMVWRPGDVRFAERREEAGIVWQTVVITDADGRMHVLEYRMAQRGGAWRVDGVRILPAPELNA